MNYIKASRTFWRIINEHDRTPNQIALYFALLECCNNNQTNPSNWTNFVVKVTNRQLMWQLGIDHHMTLDRARASLVKKKLIKYERGKHDRTYSKYTLLFEETTVHTTISNIDTVEVETVHATVNGTVHATVNGTVSKSDTVLPIIQDNKRNEKKSLPDEGFKFFKNYKTAGEQQ